MKKTIFLLTIISVLSGFGICHAQSSDKSKPSTVTVKVRKQHQQSPTRPLVPDNNCVTFVYDSADGTCTFSSTREFLHMDVDIVSLSVGESYSETITAEYPVMYAPLSRGEYHIICVTDDSATYSGDFTIE